MDLSLSAKLIAATLVGATAATHLRQPDPSDTAMLKLEWIQTGGKKEVESLHLRAQIGETTQVDQNGRRVEVLPLVQPDGSYLIKLSVVDGSRKAEPESLNTGVHVQSGETVVVMGNTWKGGKETKERMLFLTAGPV